MTERVYENATVKLTGLGRDGTGESVLSEVEVQAPDGDVVWVRSEGGDVTECFTLEHVTHIGVLQSDESCAVGTARYGTVTWEHTSVPESARVKVFADGWLRRYTGPYMKDGEKRWYVHDHPPQSWASVIFEADEEGEQA